MQQRQCPSGGIRFQILVALLLLSAAPALAQDPVALPTRGTRFWTGFIQNGFGAQSLKVHIMSTTATSGTVSIPLSGWSTTFSVAANSVAVVTLPASAEHQGSETVSSKGVLVQSQDSVNVFISSFQNFTHDLTQVLPESSIGSAYRVDSYHGIPNFNNLHKSEVLIVATQDGTELSITPSVPTAGGHAANVPFTVALNEGQSYQLQAANDNLDLTGTVITGTANSGACRPFVVIGGSMCATLPGSCSACDVIFEQLFPLSAWGERYFTAPIHGVNQSTYRILADQNNTTVTIGGGAPIVLNAGQKHEVNATNTPVCIQADHPISVVQLLEGIVCAGTGDPSMVIVSPDTRLSQKASFSTLSSPQISQHSISLVVPPASVGQITLDGAPIPVGLFQPYAACSDRLHAKLTVTPGVHRVEAANGFQLYMFGTGSGESYGASVNDIHAIPVVQDSVVCGSGTITLNSELPLADAIWTTASDPNTIIGTGNSLTVTPTASDSYMVSGIHGVTGCPDSFTYHVGVPLTVPTLPTANGASQASICQHEQVQLGLDPLPDEAWFDVLWSPAATLDDPTSATPVATPTTSTWYKVQVSSPSGCGGTVDSVYVEVAPGRILDMGLQAEPPEFCAGGTTQLTSNSLKVAAYDPFDSGTAAFWSAIQGGTISNACGSVMGSALYFNGNGQRYAQTAALNTVNGGIIRFKLKIANGVAPCDDADPGENVVLEYSTTNGFTWSPVATYNENAYPSFTPIQLNIPAAAQTASTMFRLRQLANSGAGQDNWALDDLIIAVYDNTWLNYQWSPAVSSPSQPATSAAPEETTWFVLEGTDPTAGCVYRDSVLVTVHPSFDLEVNGDTTLCSITGVQLEAQPGIPITATYSWTPADGTLDHPDSPTPVATPSNTTTYTVNAVDENGCTANGEVTIVVSGLLDLEVSAGDTLICQGQQVQLQALANGADGLQYSWTNGSSLNSATVAAPIATPAQSTTYTCTVTDPLSGCALSQGVTVEVTTGYQANAGSDTLLCSVLGHQLHVQHNVPDPLYQWSPASALNSASIQSPTIMADASGTFTVTVTDQNGCSVTDQVHIHRALDGLPAQVDVAACANTPPELTAPLAGEAYQWSTGEITPSITPLNSGAHTLTITDENGCEGTTTFHVVLYAPPDVDLGPDLQICGEQEVDLDAGTDGVEYEWSPSGTGQTSTAYTTGTYSVTVTDANGCVSSDAVHIQFNEMPSEQVEDAYACITDPPELDAGNPGCTYLWSTGATTQTITAPASGTYTVLVTTPAGCSMEFNANVVLAPEIELELGNDTTLCQGQQVVLDAGNTGSTYQWSNGSDYQLLTANTSGTYSVVVSNGHCEATDAVTVIVAPLPVDELNDLTTCIGGTLALDAGNAGSSFLWNNGATDQVIEVSTSGLYSVEVTNTFGCSRTLDANVQFVPPPTVELGPDTVLCDGMVLILDAGPSNATYSWSTGATSRAISVTGNGIYEVTLNNGHCAVSDQISVYFNPSPTPVPDPRVIICFEEEPYHVLIDAGNSGSLFDWAGGENSQVIKVEDYGWYHVSITNVYGCQRSDSIEVVEYCPSTIFAPNTFTPNGDGLNDVFMPVGRNIASMKLSIFDRWGTMIFQTNDPMQGWDGTYRGELVTDDIYVWRATYRFFEDRNGTLGMEQEMTGHIQVLR